MENNLKIDRSEVMKLYESCISNLSVHSIGQWLKATTDEQFVILPRETAEQAIDCAVNIKHFSDELSYIQEDIEQWM
jgi:hypothetical protein